MEKCLVPRTMKVEEERKSVNPSCAALGPMPSIVVPTLSTQPGEATLGM